ncbi:iron-sulfur cluster assembly enzyme ISCU isoform X1 [Mesoplodon densirostris]|uniref:iron-sulfur cluster assembly enzyme ISCU isoform X1 n=1 Tax=Mesoplodon densirostris TaxID=48708 RepID=UPI0028DC033A|nr:iron-sulfur cluster assembly enzyme ISCU isoform X1 [Mesoplodon densirostris]
MAAAGAGRLRRATSALLLRAPRLPVRELSAPARLYHKKVVDHYENPRNVGSLDKTSKNVGTGLVGAPACGDVMKLQIQVDEKGKIVDARFKTFGCGSAIASSSLATEWVKGKTVEEALTIKNTDIAKELCLPPVKLHCSSCPQSRPAGGIRLRKQLSTCRPAPRPAPCAGRRCHQGRPG